MVDTMCNHSDNEIPRGFDFPRSNVDEGFCKNTKDVLVTIALQDDS